MHYVHQHDSWVYTCSNKVASQLEEVCAGPGLCVDVCEVNLLA